MVNLSNKRNGRKVSFLYPVNGNKNVLRTVNGVKVKSFTGPGGKGITVHEDPLDFTSPSRCLKIVAGLS